MATVVSAPVLVPVAVTTATKGTRTAPTTVVSFGGGDTTPPAPVAFLDVSTDGESSLFVEWDTVTDNKTPQAQIRYDLWWSTDETPAAHEPAMRVVEGYGPALVDGLRPETTYYFTIRARDEAGNVSIPTAADGTTAPTTAAPTGVLDLAAYVTGDGVVLVWSASEDVYTPPGNIQYRVFRFYAGDEPSLESPLATLTGTTFYLDTTASPGQTFSYLVVAVNEYDNAAEEWNVVDVLVPLSPDTTPPVVGNQSPAPGTPITPATPLEFTVSDNRALGFLLVTITDAIDGIEEVVHDGTNFRGFYAGGQSIRTFERGGWRYRLLRYGGWKGAPALRVYVSDTSGNMGG